MRAFLPFAALGLAIAAPALAAGGGGGGSGGGVWLRCAAALLGASVEHRFSQHGLLASLLRRHGGWRAGAVGCDFGSPDQGC